MHDGVSRRHVHFTNYGSKTQQDKWCGGRTPFSRGHVPNHGQDPGSQGINESFRAAPFPVLDAVARSPPTQRNSLHLPPHHGLHVCGIVSGAPRLYPSSTSIELQDRIRSIPVSISSMITKSCFLRQLKRKLLRSVELSVHSCSR